MCISNAQHKRSRWRLCDTLLALTIKFLLVYGLFAEFSRHFTSIITLIMSNGRKVGKALNVQLGRLMIGMKLKVRQFYRMMYLLGVCGTFKPCKLGWSQRGMCLIHMGFKTVAMKSLSSHMPPHQ